MWMKKTECGRTGAAMAIVHAGGWKEGNGAERKGRARKVDGERLTEMTVAPILLTIPGSLVN